MTSNSAILTAVKRNELVVVRECLNKDPASVYDADMDGVTSLHWACLEGFLDLVKLLVQSGAKIDAQTIGDGHTPLAYAAIKGKSDCFHYLLSQNVVDIPDKKGYYSIHHAAMYDQTEIIFLVLHFNLVPIDVSDLLGHTALMWAVYEGHVLSVQFLIAQGANVEKKDNVGFTALHWAALKNKRDCCEILLQQNQDLLYARDANNDTPLLVAKSNGHYTLVEYLDLLQNDTRIAKKGRYETFKYHMFMFPFIIYSYVGLIFSYIPYYYLPLVCLITLVLYVGVWRFYIQRRWTGLTISRNPYLVGQVWWGMTLSSALWLFHMTSFDQTFTLSSLLWYFWALVFTYLYHTLLFSDPGFLPTNTVTNEEIAESLSGANDDKHCLTCQLKKPLKSKHCRNTGRCVYRFDHYCAWLANAVGVLSNNLIYPDDYSSISFLRILYEQQPLVFLAIVGHFIAGLVHTHLVYQQFQLISTNLTTNELKNYTRYYPGMTQHEDHGALNNIREFFSPTVDWRTKFREKDSINESRNVSLNMQY